MEVFNMEQIITEREYKSWLESCSDRNIVEEDLNIFRRQRDKINALISMAEEVLKNEPKGNS
jgi:hypothetical protein